MPVGCVNHCSRRQRVLAQQSAETITTADTDIRFRYGRAQRTHWPRRNEAQRSMRPVPIVMFHEHSESSIQVALVRDQQPVQTLGTGGPYEPFRNAVRLRRANRRTQNLETLAAKHVIKRGREFLVAIADQKPTVKKSTAIIVRP